MKPPAGPYPKRPVEAFMKPTKVPTSCFSSTKAKGEGMRCAAESRGAASAVAITATHSVERAASFKELGSCSASRKGLTPLDGPGRLHRVPGGTRAPASKNALVTPPVRDRFHAWPPPHRFTTPRAVRGLFCVFGDRCFPAG